jgi:hypothetical protein
MREEKNKLMITNRTRTAINGKKLLIYCAIAAIIACSTVILPGSRAFAATSPHMSAVPATKSSAIVDDFIFPAWNFFGCGTGWSSAIDFPGGGLVEYFKYSYTTGNQICTSAVWNDSTHTGNRTCDLLVYLPSYFGTAKISYGIVDPKGTQRILVYQSNFNGDFYDLGEYSSVSYVYISSNNGQTGTDMAAGQMEFYCP